jgi:hypothetical protein
MAKENKYGENTKMVCFRIPESKVAEINKMVKIKLNEYEKDFILSHYSVSDVEVVDAVIESPVVEKKSNPADVLIIENNVPEWATKHKETIKVEKKEVVSEDLEAAKKAKIAMLKEIASGNGPKKVGSFISEKTPLEERYEFDENTTLPDIEYRVAIGSKGIAFTDMYDASFVYLKQGHRYFRFSDRKEFDRFVKTEGILL